MSRKPMVGLAFIGTAFVAVTTQAAAIRSSGAEALTMWPGAEHTRVYESDTSRQGHNGGTRAAAVGVLYNSNGFEAFTAPANLGGQNSFVVDSGSTTRFTVQSTTGIASSQGVRVNGASTSDWAFAPIDYTPAAGEYVSVDADMARSLGTTANSRTFMFGIDAYASSPAFARIGRYGIANNGGALVLAATTKFDTVLGDFAPSGTLGTYIIATGLSANTYYNIEARFDFAAQTYSLYSAGNLIIDNLPFAAAGNDLADADLNAASSGTANTDQGFFDNYIVSVGLVPEPATLSVLGGVAVTLLRRRRA